MASGGVIVFVAELLLRRSWRARTYANQNTLQFRGDAIVLNPYLAI